MTAPMRLIEFEVPADWVDYNDHLNDAYHAVAFSRAGDEFMERIGLGPAGREATGRTIYTLGLIIRYLAEAKLGERIAISLQILETDAKRVRFWLEARRVDDDALVSTSEQVLICVDRTRRARARRRISPPKSPPDCRRSPPLTPNSPRRWKPARGWPCGVDRPISAKP